MLSSRFQDVKRLRVEAPVKGGEKLDHFGGVKLDQLGEW